MDKDELLARAKAAGIKGAHLMKPETLAERLGELEQEAPAQDFDGDIPAGVECVVLADNLWIGDYGPREERRKVKGDRVVIDSDLAQRLAAENRVVIL